MTRYSRARIWLHWLVVLLILLQWLTADGMGRAVETQERQEAPVIWDFLLSNLHLFCGASVLLLTIWRINLRLKSRHSGGPASHRFLDLLSRLTHWALLGVLLFLPVTGVLSYYQLVPLADRGHEWGAWILLGLIGVHMLGLVWHSWRDRSILSRMLPPERVKADSANAEPSSE